MQESIEFESVRRLLRMNISSLYVNVPRQQFDSARSSLTRESKQAPTPADSLLELAEVNRDAEHNSGGEGALKQVVGGTVQLSKRTKPWVMHT